MLRVMILRRFIAQPHLCTQNPGIRKSTGSVSQASKCAFDAKGVGCGQIQLGIDCVARPFRASPPLKLTEAFRRLLH